jgi:hypothetical protein
MGERCWKKPFVFFGSTGVGTQNLTLAREVLYHLSMSPVFALVILEIVFFFFLFCLGWLVL